jgi:plasmid stabilization system protein ParE
MKVEYSNRAVADLRKVSTDAHEYGEAVTVAVEARIRAIAHIAEHPEAAPRVAERPNVHVVPLVRFPYKIFYRRLDDRVRILHPPHITSPLDKRSLIEISDIKRSVRSAIPSSER